jgi:hypothetical protein
MTVTTTVDGAWVVEDGWARHGYTELPLIPVGDELLER